MSPVEQDTIDCEHLNYFEAKKNNDKKNYKRDIMQLFRANATIFFIFFAHENMKKLP